MGARLFPKLVFHLAHPTSALRSAPSYQTPRVSSRLKIMRLMNAQSPDESESHLQNSPHHLTESDLHDLTSEMEAGIPNQITSNMYYPSFPDPNISTQMMNYPYHPISQESMDLTYMLTTNIPVPHNLLVGETPQAGPSGLQNGHGHDTSSSSISPSHYSVQIQPASPQLHQSPTATTIQSPKNSSFPTMMHVHAHTMLPPIVHPDPSDPALQSGADVRPSLIYTFICRSYVHVIFSPARSTNVLIQVHPQTQIHMLLLSSRNNLATPSGVYFRLDCLSVGSG